MAIADEGAHSLLHTKFCYRMLTGNSDYLESIMVTIAVMWRFNSLKSNC